jgi:hypothetical protein
MSKFNANQEPESAIMTPANPPPDVEKVANEVTATKMSIWGEIKKGWEWVVFTWRMLGRLGGFRAIVNTIFRIISLLIQRMLVQWGIISKK